MEKYTMSDLGIFITTIAGAIVLILGALQKSKCSRIKCCPPECIRDPTLKTDKDQPTPRLPQRNPTNP